MQIEILALRHELAVLQAHPRKRPRLGRADRLLWVLLSRVWAQWRSALVIVKPETVIAWQRKGFRLYWVGCIIATSEELPESTHPSRPLFLLQLKSVKCRSSVIATIVSSCLSH